MIIMKKIPWAILTGDWYSCNDDEHVGATLVQYVGPHGDVTVPNNNDDNITLRWWKWW